MDLRSVLMSWRLALPASLLRRRQPSWEGYQPLALQQALERHRQ